jgi:quercetin dioxygenase-like cupin family protein
VSDDGPKFFQLDTIPWPAEEPADTPPELVAEAKRLGARRKFLAQGEGGFHSQVSEFPAGYVVPTHSHGHDEMIVILEGGCTMLGDGGPSLEAGDSMVLLANFEYGFEAGADGMTFMTIRTAKSSTKLV